MRRFDPNRLCPLSGQEPVRVLGHITPAQVGRSNPTYRSNFCNLLGLAPDDEFPIVEGPGGFSFAGWLPREDFLRRVYEEAIDHARSVTETVWYRQGLLDFAAGFLARVKPARDRALRLLDYGCGYGALLRMLASRDIQAFGYEPSAARSAAAGQPNVRILTDLDEVVEAGPFDLFVCTEVLEHVPDPRAVLKFFRANAAPGALLAVTVPNCSLGYVQESLRAASAGGELSPVFNPWEHLNYFSSGSLRSLLAEEGFAVVNDFGRVTAMREACLRFGDERAGNVAVDSLRVAKRAWTAAPSTELFCRCL